jgi:hypothetical protein
MVILFGGGKHEKNIVISVRVSAVSFERFSGKQVVRPKKW